MADRITDEGLDQLIENGYDPKKGYLETLGDELASELRQLRRLVRDFTDSGDCWFDHHGGCQAHGYLEPEPGEKCPHGVAKQLIAEWDEADRSDR